MLAKNQPAETSMGTFSAIESKWALAAWPDEMRIGIWEPTSDRNACELLSRPRLRLGQKCFARNKNERRSARAGRSGHDSQNEKNKFSRAVRRFSAWKAQKMGILDHLFTHTICKNLGG